MLRIILLFWGQLKVLSALNDVYVKVFGDNWNHQMGVAYVKYIFTIVSTRDTPRCTKTQENEFYRTVVDLSLFIS